MIWIKEASVHLLPLSRKLSALTSFITKMKFILFVNEQEFHIDILPKNCTCFPDVKKHKISKFSKMSLASFIEIWAV